MGHQKYAIKINQDSWRKGVKPIGQVHLDDSNLLVIDNFGKTVISIPLSAIKEASFIYSFVWHIYIKVKGAKTHKWIVDTSDVKDSANDECLRLSEDLHKRGVLVSGLKSSGVGVLGGGFALADVITIQGFSKGIRNRPLTKIMFAGLILFIVLLLVLGR
jgi:hypothetical protein